MATTPLTLSLTGAKIVAGKISLAPGVGTGSINIVPSGGTGTVNAPVITKQPPWTVGKSTPSISTHPDDGSHTLLASRPPFDGLTGRYEVSVSDSATPTPVTAIATLDIEAVPAAGGFILKRPKAQDLVIDTNTWPLVFHRRVEGTLTPAEQAASPAWFHAVFEVKVWKSIEDGRFVIDVLTRHKAQESSRLTAASAYYRQVSKVFEPGASDDDVCTAIVDTRTQEEPSIDGYQDLGDWFRAVFKPALPPFRP